MAEVVSARHVLLPTPALRPYSSIALHLHAGFGLAFRVRVAWSDFLGSEWCSGSETGIVVLAFYHGGVQGVFKKRILLLEVYIWGP